MQGAKIQYLVHPKILFPFLSSKIGVGGPGPFDLLSELKRYEVGDMESKKEYIKALRPDEEESVLRWAAATGFDVEGALEVLRKRYYDAMGAWEL